MNARRGNGIAALALACALLPGMDPAPACAAETRAQPAFPVQRGPRVRAEVLERLQAAQDAADANDYARALELLDALQRERGATLNSYERANLFYFYGFIHDARGQPREAVAAYEQVLAQRDLPETMQQGTRYSLAKLYLAIEQWAQAAAMLEAWFRATDQPPPEAHVLRAQAWYHLEKYAAAIGEAEAALAEARRRRQPPQEAWYVLLRALAYESGDLRRTAATLETLARNWPRKEYLLQLSGIHGELGDTPRRVAAMETAYFAGWLASESELLGMAYLYLESGLPARAARLLEQALADGLVQQNAQMLDLVGIAWQQAREGERAMPWLERAAREANDAAMWARLAGIELDANRYAEAVAAAQKGLADRAGGGQARIVLGTALYRLGRLQEAREAFTAVPSNDAAARSARDWLRFLDTEIARAEELARDV